MHLLKFIVKYINQSIVCKASKHHVIWVIQDILVIRIIQIIQFKQIIPSLSFINWRFYMIQDSYL